MTNAAHPLISFSNLDQGLTMLTDVFGSTEHAVYRNEAGVIEHCEVAYGETIVMPSERTGTFWSLGAISLYLSTEDPDALHDRCVAAGMEILQPPTDQDYGSREFATKDFSGNVWIFGTYKPEPAS